MLRHHVVQDLFLDASAITLDINGLKLFGFPIVKNLFNLYFKFKNEVDHKGVWVITKRVEPI